MDWTNLIITIISGIAGGNIAGAAAPDKSLGAAGNTIAGLIGGGAGNYILQALGAFAQNATTTAATTGAAAASSGLDIGSILGHIGGGGIGGAILMLIAGAIKNATQKQ